MAQGSNVRSSVEGGGYDYKDGTSMATPHVAGAIGLLKSAFPDATPYELKAALLFSAHDLGPSGEDNTYGMGIINLPDAYEFLKQSLIGDTLEWSVSPKQREVILSLHAGSANANRFYVLMAGISGSTPGTTLPGGVVLPLNMDFLTQASLVYTNTQNFQNFSGNLDASGSSVAILYGGRLIDSSLIGTVFTLAFCTWPPPGFDFVSNAWEIEVTP